MVCIETLGGTRVNDEIENEVPKYKRKSRALHERLDDKASRIAYHACLAPSQQLTTAVYWNNTSRDLAGAAVENGCSTQKCQTA